MTTPVTIETNVQLAAMRQIHCAIVHLHKGDYECAITLAGAAEGMLPPTDEHHFRQKLLALSKSPEIQSSGGAAGPNDFINWLKHGTIVKGGPRIEKAIIPPLESVAVVWRAITKFWAVYNDVSPQMINFHAWAKIWIAQGSS